MLGHSKHHVGRFEEARAHLQRYRLLDTDAARSASIRATGYDRRVDAFALLSNTLWILGRPDQAKALTAHALQEARTLGFAIPIGLAMEWACMNAYLMEPDIDIVEHDVAELLEQGRTHAIDSDSGWALSLMGLCQARRGQFDTGARLVTEGLQLLAKARMDAFDPLVLAHICEAAVRSARLDEAVYWFARLDRKDAVPDHWCSAEILRVRGLLAEARGDREGAMRKMQDAMALAHRQSALSWELRAACALGELLNADGRPSEALAILQPLYEKFSEGRGTADLIAARRLLDELKGSRDAEPQMTSLSGRRHQAPGGN